MKIVLKKTKSIQEVKQERKKKAVNVALLVTTSYLLGAASMYLLLNSF